MSFENFVERKSQKHFSKVLKTVENTDEAIKERVIDVQMV